jgi:hypothetical protein
VKDENVATSNHTNIELPSPGFGLQLNSIDTSLFILTLYSIEISPTVSSVSATKPLALVESWDTYLRRVLLCLERTRALIAGLPNFQSVAECFFEANKTFGRSGPCVCIALKATR